MQLAVTLLLFLLLPLAPARAALAPADLDAVGLAPAPGATLPADVSFTDQRSALRRLGDVLGHRPTVFLLADYDCREICGPILAVVGGALGGTGLTAGRDYDLVAVGLNPRATPADAARMGAAQLGPLATQATLLSGTPAAVDRVERALDYHAAFDAASGRYAHPADILVLTADGRVSRVLPGLSLDPETLRLALVEAGEGRIGTLGDRLHLLCYGLDPAHGIANRAVSIILTSGGVLTLAGLALFVVGLRLRSTSRSRTDLHIWSPAVLPSPLAGEGGAQAPDEGSRRRMPIGHGDPLSVSRVSRDPPSPARGEGTRAQVTIERPQARPPGSHA